MADGKRENMREKESTERRATTYDMSAEEKDMESEGDMEGGAFASGS